MSVFFTRRGKAAQAGPVLVTITGSGATDVCTVTISGTVYIAAASGIEVMPGDVITLVVAGIGFSSGQITIDGTVVATASTIAGTTPATYTWTVPENIEEASIAMSITTGTGASKGGIITVTTS